MNWNPRELDPQERITEALRTVVRSGISIEDLEKMTTKDTNPKDAVGVTKPPMSCIPANVLVELGAAMLEGACKYGRHNYRDAGVRASVYYDAAMRHLMAWWEGEDDDPDSGVSHVTKAIAGLVVLRDAMMNDMVSDDRPPPPFPDWMKSVQAQVDAIRGRHPDPKPPYTR